ncbi:hypothetical protein LTR47_009742 [Exophiala xenobiotica]|nr:hypothetical protein LTR41_010513 [Exophiala xenobiotica]KAK5216263.1 hypothetical protein LTR72_010657 [Exophiala xenobiotica]KAK5224307.1 hypothetical protein LTR47_009742 [Exophiala xenobiotica]KAK5247723.1 hypothetical protein LTS06_007116 [Exophiala xenobiotica]KAK5260000.1 hypothetical protein LTR40_004946 [Exophiala xenobiotica]
MSQGVILNRVKSDDPKWMKLYIISPPVLRDFLTISILSSPVESTISSKVTMLWKSLLVGLALWATALAYPASEDDSGVPTSETGYDNATFGALDSAANTVTVKVGCHGKNELCTPFLKVLDTSIPDPERYCTREALGALAIWRMFCQHSKFYSFCDNRAPSIERCCSKWVDKDDPKWKDYPPRMERKNGKWVPTEKGDKRKIIRTKSEEYDDLVGGYFSGCGYWKPREPGEYTWVINHLGDYGMKDVDKNGKIIGEEKWNAEEGGK